jgi:hypothetical protein
MDNNSSKYKNGSTSQLIKTGGGIFKGVIINSNPSPAAMSLTISDGLDDAGVAVKAKTRLFFTNDFYPASPALNSVQYGTDNVSDGDSMLIGTTLYTWKNTPAKPFDVKIGATIEDSLVNMSEATRGMNVGTSSFAGTTAQGQICYFFDPLDPESSTTVSKTFDESNSDIPVIVTSSVLTPAGNRAGSYVQAIPKEQASFTLGTKTYYFVTILTDDICGVFGIPTPVGTENEITDGGTLADNILAAINGDGGAGEGTAYSVGTTPNDQVDCDTPDASTVYFVAKNTGSYGNSIVAKSNCEKIVLGTDINTPFQTLVGGQDASQSVMILKSSQSSDTIKVKPVEFYQGLYVTVGGTVDYTIIYS